MLAEHHVVGRVSHDMGTLLHRGAGGVGPYHRNATEAGVVDDAIRPSRPLSAALAYSLIESAKLCGVEPRAYLREAALRAVRDPGAVTLARDAKAPES